MIDPLTEDIVLPREAPKYLPPGPDGKRLHVSAVYRYMTTGVRGIVLESLKAPRRCTSRQAIARFMRRLSEEDQQCPERRHVTSGGIADHAIEAELDRLGI
jgi:hypothetical protein